jgi:hypothetical protein
MSATVEPRISRCLALLEELRAATAACAAQEDEMTKDLARRRYVAERKYQNALKDSAARLAREQAESDASFKKRWEHVRAWHAARHIRLEKAERAAKRELPKRVQAARGDWLGRLQRQKLRLEKEVATELHEAETSLKAAKLQLASQSAQAGEILAQARPLLRSSLTLARRAAATVAGAPGDAGSSLDTARESLERLRGTAAVKLSGLLPAWLLAPVLLAAGGVLYGVLHQLPAAAACGGAAVAVLALYVAASGRLRTDGAQLAAGLAAARGHIAAREQEAQRRFDEIKEHAHRRQASGAAEIKDQWGRVGGVESDFTQAAQEKLKKQVFRMAERNEKSQERKLAALEAGHAQSSAVLAAAAQERERQAAAVHEMESAALNDEEARRWAQMQTAWHRDSGALWGELTTLSGEASRLSRPWSPELVHHWQPATAFDPVAAFAQL